MCYRIEIKVTSLFVSDVYTENLPDPGTLRDKNLDKEQVPQTLIIVLLRLQFR